MKQNGNEMLEVKNEKLERKCFEQNKIIISFESEINRLEEFNKELKLDFNKKVELFKIKENNWKIENESYVKLEAENHTLKTMVREKKSEFDSKCEQINELEMKLKKTHDLNK
jgi:hypothetical protein